MIKNINEAYKILNLDSFATIEEVQDRYRELAKKYHPDINKEPNAEDKFKKIGEAYTYIKNEYKTNGKTGSYAKHSEEGKRKSNISPEEKIKILIDMPNFTVQEHQILFYNKINNAKTKEELNNIVLYANRFISTYNILIQKIAIKNEVERRKITEYLNKQVNIDGLKSAEPLIKIANKKQEIINEYLNDELLELSDIKYFSTLILEAKNMQSLENIELKLLKKRKEISFTRNNFDREYYHKILSSTDMSEKDIAMWLDVLSKCKNNEEIENLLNNIRRLLTIKSNKDTNSSHETKSR